MNKLWLEEIEKAIQNLELPREPSTLYDPFQYTMDMGGKRIRPYLTLLASGIASGRHKNAIQAALAIEILHNFTLVHDDIMDQANTRRGITCVHKKWDSNVAILSGDVMYVYAFQQLLYYGKNEHISAEAFHTLMDIFVQATIKICDGQALDMELMQLKKVIVNQYIEMIEGKTGALLSAALGLGVIVGGRLDLLTNMQELGMLMGVAFQMQDDLLDVTAEPENFGKKKAGDILEGKKTYLWIRTYEQCNTNEQIHMDLAYTGSKAQLNDEWVTSIIELMYKYKVIDEISDLINNKYGQIYDIIREFEDSHYRSELHQLINYLKSRKK
mgnify:CR=1 FL=1|tara:strand:- start:526 stop:1509 length:984 start_codon:yes stop_codon:yes gene_type:complete